MGSGKGGAGGGGGGGAPTSEPTPPPQSAEDVLGPADNYVTSEVDEILGLADDVNPGGQLVGKGKLVENLTEQELIPIKRYTGENVTGVKYANLTSELLNAHLRIGKTLGEAQEAVYKAFQKSLNKSLSKLRSYKGETYRTVSDASGKIASQYIPGKVIKQKDFISTSRATNASSFSYSSAGVGRTRFKIQSKTGKAIEKASQYRGEQEVLFKSGSKFKVTSKTWNIKRGTWDISLTEL